MRRQVGSSTDAGYFGAGIYFSEHFSTSAAYNTAGKKMLLCKLLVGKPYNMQGRVQSGSRLKAGYTSHVADATGSEVVIFDEAAMLPLFAVNMCVPVQSHARASPTIAPCPTPRGPSARQQQPMHGTAQEGGRCTRCACRGRRGKQRRAPQGHQFDWNRDGGWSGDDGREVASRRLDGGGWRLTSHDGGRPPSSRFRSNADGLWKLPWERARLG